MSPKGSVRRRLLPIAVGSTLMLGAFGCAGPEFSPPVADAGSGWATDYPDALSPHTQLALGLMKSVEEGTTLKNRARLAEHWQILADRVDAGADSAEVNEIRRKIESDVEPTLLQKLQSERYNRSDLMAYMLSSGMKIPKRGPTALNPDVMAARQAVKLLRGEAAPKEVFVVKSVPPEEVLTPVESLTLGTVKLLAEDRDSFEMSQVFRLALYFRPLRRVYDPNPDLVEQGDQQRQETVYMDRIWRTLKPDQIRKIREWNLTRQDMNDYLQKHVQLYKVNWKEEPTFALLEYAVNDFHEQIAPQVTIPQEEKGDFFIPTSLTRLSGREPGDGKRLYEGVCAACHGVDGQGRFPPIGVPSYLSLHSDHEHFHIIRSGPPQKPGSSVVMPTFQDKLTDDQIWAVAKYIRSFENVNFQRRGESAAKKAGVKFYKTADVYKMWQNGRSEKHFLDVQSDIAFRIMGHMSDSQHIRPEEFERHIKGLPKEKEIILYDMFGSQGVVLAQQLAEAGYKVGYMEPGMMDWHINRNFPVAYD